MPQCHIYHVHGTSELRDKLVFILVHDEVIIKLPQNIGGIIITISLSAHSQHEVTELTAHSCLVSLISKLNVVCFISSGFYLLISWIYNMLTFYMLIILVLVYTEEIVQAIGFQAKHVSSVRNDINLVRRFRILLSLFSSYFCVVEVVKIQNICLILIRNVSKDWDMKYSYLNLGKVSLLSFQFELHENNIFKRSKHTTMLNIKCYHKLESKK